MKKICIIMLILIHTLSVNAQEEEEKSRNFSSYLSGSYIFGAQVYNSNFLFKPAYALNFNHNYKLNKDIELGLGAGVMLFEEETFVPIFAEFLARKHKKRSDRFVKIDLGYSIASNSYIENNDAYKLKGGFIFKSGLGSIYEINDDYGLSFGFNYIHQFSELVYTTYYSETYGDVLNYSMIEISIGLVLQ